MDRRLFITPHGARTKPLRKRPKKRRLGSSNTIFLLPCFQTLEGPSLLLSFLFSFLFSSLLVVRHQALKSSEKSSPTADVGLCFLLSSNKITKGDMKERYVFPSLFSPSQIISPSFSFSFLLPPLSLFCSWIEARKRKAHPKLVLVQLRLTVLPQINYPTYKGSTVQGLDLLRRKKQLKFWVILGNMAELGIC